MKKNFILYIISILLFMSSCEKGLDPEFYGSLNPNTFPSTITEYELYTMEVYVPFGCKWPYAESDGTKYHFFGLEEGHIQMFDACTDLMPVFSGWGDGDVQWISKGKGDFKGMVASSPSRSHFEKTRFVTRCTQIISDLENATIFNSSKDKYQLVAEAKLARGLAMYYMLHLFGPVPVILDPAKIGTEAEEDLTRPTRAEYVNAIESDMKFAADSLAKAADFSSRKLQYGRFNKEFALVSLMRLYLNEKNYSAVVSTGNEILPLGHGLVTNYADLFKEATEKNNETLFAIATTSTSEGRGAHGNFNAYPYYCFPWGYPGFNGWGIVFSASWQFYDSFDPADTRRSLLIESNGTSYPRSSLPGALINKFAYTGTTTFFGMDIPLARYSDVLLMLAEAINHTAGQTTEAIGYVNDVRRRAGLEDLPAADYASVEAFDNAILRERGWEFYFEGLRKFDLVRMGKWNSAVSSIPGKTPGPHLLPFPQYVLDKSKGKITQNDGY